MSTGELLNIDPVEMKFHCEFCNAPHRLGIKECYSICIVELKKKISCSLQVSNKTEEHVAFKIKTTNPNKYGVRPYGIVLPRSSCDIVVTMRAQEEAPAEMQCKDKFLIQSVIAPAGTTSKDITSEMFNKEQGKVEECILKVSYVAPRAEEAENLGELLKGLGFQILSLKHKIC